MLPNTIKKIKDEPLQAAVQELHTIAQKQEKKVHNMEKFKRKVRNINQRELKKLSKRGYLTNRKTYTRKRLLLRLYKKISDEVMNAQNQNYKLISQHKSQYAKLKNKLDKLKQMLMDVPQLWLDFHKPLMELEEQLQIFENKPVTEPKDTHKTVQKKRKSKKIYKMTPEVAELYKQMTEVERIIKEKAKSELPYELMSVKSTMEVEEKKKKQRRLKSKARPKKAAQKKIIHKVANVDDAKKQTPEQQHRKPEVTNLTKVFANEISRPSLASIKSQITPKLLENKKVPKRSEGASRKSDQSVSDIKKENVVDNSKKGAKQIKQKKKANDNVVKNKSKTATDAVTKKRVKKPTSKIKPKQQENKTVVKEISGKSVRRKAPRRQYCKRDSSIKKKNNVDVSKKFEPNNTPEQLLKRKGSTESILIKNTQLYDAGKSRVDNQAEEKHFSISSKPIVEVIFMAEDRKKSELPWVKPRDSIMLNKERISQSKLQNKSRPSASNINVLGNVSFESQKKFSVNKGALSKKLIQRSSKYSVSEKAPLGARIKITQSMLSYMSHSGILQYSKLPKRETDRLIEMKNALSKAKFMRKLKRVHKGSIPKHKHAPRIGSESAKNLIESMQSTSTSQLTSGPSSYRETYELKPIRSSVYKILTKISTAEQPRLLPKLKTIEKKRGHDITGFKFQKVVNSKKRKKEPTETPPAGELKESQLDSGFPKIEDSDLATYKRIYNLLLRQETPTEEKDLELLDDYARNPTKYNLMLQKLYDMRVTYSETSYDRNLLETEFSRFMQTLSARQRKLRLKRDSSLGSPPSFQSLLVQNATPPTENFAAEAMRQKWVEFFAEQSVTPTKLLEQKQKQEQELKRLSAERRRLQLEGRELLRRNQHFGAHVRQHDNPRKTIREQRVLAMIFNEKNLEKPSMKKHVCEMCGMSDCSDSESELEDCQTSIAATQKIIDQFKHLRLHL